MNFPRIVEVAVAQTPFVHLHVHSSYSLLEGALPIARLAALFRGQVSSEVPPYLNERRQLRIYDENALFILKPSEVRYWTRTAGLNDGDAVLADHWIKGLHASVA